MAVTYENARETIIQVLAEAGEQGIRALELYTEVTRRLDDDTDPLSICRRCGFEPEDICKLNYH
jgi:hypothetical protein